MPNQTTVETPAGKPSVAPETGSTFVLQQTVNVVMKVERTIWLSLLVPTLCCALPISLGVLWWVESPAIAASVLVACLLSAAANSFLLTRNSHLASAQLRRPELRRKPLAGGGPYDELLDEALRLLEQVEGEAGTAQRSKSELEARAHVRRKQVRQLEAAVGFLDDPLLITDTHDQLQFFNPASVPLLTTTVSEATDGNRVQTFELEHLEPIKQLLDETRTRSAANDHRTCEFDWDIAGENITFRATATNVYDTDDTMLGVVTLLHDIRNEYEQKAKHAEFVSSVCHELKTPLASIKAYTEMLIDHDVPDPEEQKELYGFIETQVERLTRLVDNMLNITRIQSGVIKVQREDCELNDVLQKSLEVVQPTAEEKNIRLIPELSELYLAVHVDKDVFGQGIINLLSNAIKYTPANGEVRLRSRIDDDQAVIDVRDTGMGIPEDSLAHIFDRFYRVPENSKAAAGTGLGLSLVNYIVTELHNGTISVQSTVEKGTCFTVRIPLGHCSISHKKQQATACHT